MSSLMNEKTLAREITDEIARQLFEDLRLRVIQEKNEEIDDLHDKIDIMWNWIAQTGTCGNCGDVLNREDDKFYKAWPEARDWPELREEVRMDYRNWFTKRRMGKL